ncbi:MAG TPA: glycosyl transferase [Vicinamibacteria bacterium]|nr:glycosyl transferase [Vicinamibacteria bacterium]
MSDFHQSGPVTALPRLVARRIGDLEAQIQAHTARFPVALVIPMVPSEMDRPALSRILGELKHVGYLDTLVVSLNKANAVDYARAAFFFNNYPGRKVILWNEAPPVVEFVRHLETAGLYTGEPGKGRACWLALGLVLAEERTEYVAFQDADVVNFSREMLARLVLPAVDPTVDFDFVKGYYARVSDRLHGRVTRLLLAPLLAAFTRLMGTDPYVRYVASFRYALSGEFAVKCDLAQRMRLACDWGLEIVTLFEALRHRAANRICQVELAESYDHKHQELSPGDPSRGIHRMAKDVTKHLLRTLAAAGVNLSGGLMRSVLAAYQREAEDAIADSYAVARINGLAYDRHEEETVVHVFTQALRASIDEFLGDPLGTPLVPNWVRIWAGVPNASVRLLQAVRKSGEGIAVVGGVATGGKSSA